MKIFTPVKPAILVVDDTAANRLLLCGLLDPYYTVSTASRGEAALDQCRDHQPDLVLLDIMMPGLDGFEVCRRLKADAHTEHIPVIFLTSKVSLLDEQKCMSLGAVDYINRPINPPILLSRVRAHLVESNHARTLRINNEYLEYEISRTTRQLTALQNVTMLALASLAETRDTETGNHLVRTQNYMNALGNALRNHPRFADALRGQRVQMLFRCAPLHDIGKVGIPDRILLKPGRFTPEEFEVMKTHTTLGRDAIEKAQSMSDERMEFLELAKEIAYSHHERWDGSGYPLGLAGELIPVSARLMALADVYDAMTTRRVYKEGMTHEQTLEHIVRGRGTHFDPDVVDAFVALSAQFREIAISFADTEEDLRNKAAQQVWAG